MLDHIDKKNHDIASPNEAILILILTLVFIFLISIIMFLIGFNNSYLLLAEAFFVLPAIIYVNFKRYSWKKSFRLKSINFDIFIPSVIIGLSLSIISSELDRLVELVFPMPDFLNQAIINSFTINSFSDLIIILSSSVFFAAISEELLFRGFVQTSFENSFDVIKAIMLTSLAFSIIHMNPWWTIQIILFAIFLGVMAWKSDSVIPPMIAHFINNGLSVLMINMSESSLSWYLYKGHVNPILILIALGGLSFGMQLFYRNCDENKQETSNNRPSPEN